MSDQKESFWWSILVLLVLRLVVATADVEVLNEEALDDDEDDGDYWGDLHRTIRETDHDEDDVAKMDLDEIERRLKDILDIIDGDDDGFVEKNELETWMDKSARQLRDDETKEDFEDSDDDNDDLVSWVEHVREHYKAHKLQHPDDAPDGGMLEFVLKNDKAMFDLADEDDDGQLTMAEFGDLSQPDEDKALLALLLQQTMQRQDTDRNGKLTAMEFREFASGDEDTSKDEFEELDADDDDDLEGEELSKWLQHDYSTEIQTIISDLLEEADDDDDGQLSFEELLEEPQLMKRSLVLEIGTQMQHRGHIEDDDDDDDNNKDEL